MCSTTQLFRPAVDDKFPDCSHVVRLKVETVSFPCCGVGLYGRAGEVGSEELGFCGITCAGAIVRRKGPRSFRTPAEDPRLVFRRARA